MTDAYGLATVTALLETLLVDNLEGEAWLNDVDVTSRPPSMVLEDENQTGLNLFMYRVDENRGWPNRGQSHPRSSQGGDPPILALNLQYMLTAIGTEDFQSDVLLGHGMQALEEHNILPADTIRDRLKNAKKQISHLTDTQHKALLTAGLAEQIEEIKISPTFHDDETLSKIWSSIQSNFRPSAFYEVTTVLISRDTDDAPSPPVQQPPGFHVSPGMPPQINDVEPVTEVSSNPPVYEPTDRILAGHPVRISGSGLGGDHVRIRLDGEEIVDEVNGVNGTLEEKSNDELIYTLPDDLSAGTHSLQVVHLYAPGDEEEDEEEANEDPSKDDLRLLFQTGVEPFVVYPAINEIKASGTLVEVKVNPEFRPGQRGYLLLTPTNNEEDKPPVMISLVEVDTNTSWLQGEMPDEINAGETYDAMLQLDGANSEKKQVTVDPSTEQRLVTELKTEEKSAQEARVKVTVKNGQESTFQNTKPVLVWTDEQGTKIKSKELSTNSEGKAKTTFPTDHTGVYRVHVERFADSGAIYNPFHQDNQRTEKYARS